MVVPLSVAWRFAFAIVLLVAICLSACMRPPRQSVAPAELRRLVLCALILYGVGGLATLTHHGALARLVYGAGIVIAALAAWLSRGRDQEDPPQSGEPIEQPPPPAPDGVPSLDWARFEREFRDYARRPRRSPDVSGRR